MKKVLKEILEDVINKDKYLVEHDLYKNNIICTFCRTEKKQWHKEDCTVIKARTMLGLTDDDD